MRRLVWGTAFVVLLLGGCGSGKGTVDVSAILTSSPSKTLAAKSADVSMAIKLNGSAAQSQGLGELPGTGSFDFAGRRGQITTSILGQSILGVYDGGTIYEHIPQLARLAGGKQWFKIDLNQIGKLVGVSGLGNLAQAQQSDPTTGLNYLRGVSGPITIVGREVVRGVPTTHYRATADLNKAVANAPADQRATVQQIGQALGVTTVPVEAWIDEQGRVRRLHQTIDYSKAKVPNVPAGSLPQSIDITVELFDFGVPVSVTVPPPSQVQDLGQLLQGLGG
jgi:hypothetical protein